MKSGNQGYPPQPYPQQPYPQQPYASPNPYAEARSFAPPPPPPQINTQYQSHATPTLTRQPTNPNFNPQVNPKFASPASPERPQFATFDARSKPVNEDALPAMPSWKNARSVQVEVEEEAVPERRGDVEMDRLNHNGSVPNSSTAGVAAAAVGAGMRPSPGRSPVSPMQGADAYGFPPGYQDQYDRNTSPAYGANAGYAQNNYNRGPSPAQSYRQSPDPYDRRSPVQQQPYNQPYNNTARENPYNPPSERYNSPAPPSYHTTANPYSYAPAPVQSYDQPRSNTPGYGNGNGNAAYDPVPNRSQTATPSAYPGQQTYQAFQPQGLQGQQYSGIARKPVEGSTRDI